MGSAKIRESRLPHVPGALGSKPLPATVKKNHLDVIYFLCNMCEMLRLKDSLLLRTNFSGLSGPSEVKGFTPFADYLCK